MRRVNYVPQHPPNYMTNLPLQNQPPSHQLVATELLAGSRRRRRWCWRGLLIGLPQRDASCITLGFVARHTPPFRPPRYRTLLKLIFAHNFPSQGSTRSENVGTKKTLLHSHKKVNTKNPTPEMMWGFDFDDTPAVPPRLRGWSYAISAASSKASDAPAQDGETGASEDEEESRRLRSRPEHQAPHPSDSQPVLPALPPPLPHSSFFPLGNSPTDRLLPATTTVKLPKKRMT